MRPVPARLTLHALIALCVLTHTCFNGTRMTLSLAALKWGATPALVGALMALYALLPMLLGLAAGRWVDRIGARRPMLLGTAFLGLGVAVSAAWPARPARPPSAGTSTLVRRRGTLTPYLRRSTIPSERRTMSG